MLCNSWITHTKLTNLNVFLSWFAANMWCLISKGRSMFRKSAYVIALKISRNTVFVTLLVNWVTIITVRRFFQSFWLSYWNTCWINHISIIFGYFTQAQTLNRSYCYMIKKSIHFLLLVRWIELISEVDVYN